MKRIYCKNKARRALTAEQAVEIRRLRRLPAPPTLKELALRFGVAASTVQLVASGATYSPILKSADAFFGHTFSPRDSAVPSFFQAYDKEKGKWRP